MSLRDELIKEREDAIKKLEAINLLLEKYGEYNREADNFKYKLRNRNELPDSDIRLNGVNVEVINLFEVGGYKSRIIQGQTYKVEKVGEKGLAIRIGKGELRWYTDKNIDNNFKFVK